MNIFNNYKGNTENILKRYNTCGHQTITKSRMKKKKQL